jgi:hypothetical protein
MASLHISAPSTLRLRMPHLNSERLHSLSPVGAPAPRRVNSARARSWHGVEEGDTSPSTVHPIVRHRGVRVLNHEELQSWRRQPGVRLQAGCIGATRTHRRFGRMLQTIWYQVNSGQEITSSAPCWTTGRCGAEPGGAPSSRNLCNKPLLRVRPGHDRWFSLGRSTSAERSRRSAGHHASALHRHRHAYDARQRTRSHRALFTRSFGAAS